MYFDGLSPVETVAKRGKRLTKSLAQHFLVDMEILEYILAAALINHDDTVVEVGPGKGVLTKELVCLAGKVIGIELDSTMAESLTRRIGSPNNLRVIHGDARHVDLEELFRGIDSYKLVANLPYYAANPIVRRFLEHNVLKPSIIVCMVQKEVAATMVAKAGRRTILSVAIQTYGDANIICQVPPSAFFPQPKVTSTVVKIDTFHSPIINPKDIDGFFRVVKAGFSAPRKQLSNSLSIGLNINTSLASKVLKSAGIFPQRRPGTLSVEEWDRVHQMVKGANCGVD